MASRALVVMVAGAACLVSLAGCRGSSTPTDITKLVALNDVKTGWFDAGVEKGLNKLVPTVELTLKNVSNETVSLVALNAVVRRIDENKVDEEWGGAYTMAIGSGGLAPGASTKAIALRSQLGYTGTETRALMLKNHQFVDVRVQLFVKYGGDQWVKLGEWPVARDLLTQ
jgi:hypothetical protein